MTNEKFIESVALTLGKTKEETSEILKITFGIISNAIIAGKSVEIDGFGEFIPCETKDRPSVGDPEKIVKGHRKIRFEPSERFKKMLSLFA